ncbi:putative protein OS=Streptomyces fumanus OX=67302 GN=GCM10018772_70740 PE=4 SV=1 [Streptomyces fumanus]|uniref:Uncharacterized protein n=1 Tax=Streptomyces fumanus TaxID=67302 RepID=A0A919EBY9_9ACTN|nr:hypothetical protein [Streptomyces fumanus]GHF35046.1 hypothetical protein GCM10018772_70740 [Streptomyces fumanus]
MSAPEENHAERAARLPFVARPAAREVVVIDAEPEDSDADRATRLPFVARTADGEPE